MITTSLIRRLLRLAGASTLLCASALEASTYFTASSDPVDAGRMRNPFIGWAGPLSPHQQERYRASFSAQNTFVGNSPWVKLQMEVHQPPEQEYPDRGDEDMTAFAFRFDAEGNPIDKRPLPAELRFVHFNSDARSFSAQQHDRWWVLPQRAFYPEFNPDSERGNFEGFHVLKIGPAGMIYSRLAADSTPQGLRGLALMGDHLIYGYINNPNAKVEKSSRDIEVKGSPAFCLGSINLETDERVLISSIGRETVESPLEAENIRVIYHVLPLDSENFTVGEMSGISSHAYNLTTRTWRKMTAEEINRAHALKRSRENAYDSILIRGAYWKLWPQLKDGCLRLRSSGNSLLIPFDFGNNGIKPSNLPMAEYSRLSMDNPMDLKLQATLTPDGIALSDKMGSYFWIPLETFQAAVVQAHERLIAQQSSGDL